MASTLRICLLGAFQLLRDGAPVNGIRSLRLQSLLAYLVLNRATHQSRQELAFLFWPDSTEAQARGNLRKQLFDLRRAIPDIDSFLAMDARTLYWRANASASFDVDDFQEAVTRAGQARRAWDQGQLQSALEEAAALYAGDLLPACYDDWIFPERERLSRLYVNVLEELVAHLESRRDYRGAISYAQRLLRHDPLHEATYRQLMRLHALGGERAAALRVYHTCATILQRELDVAPSPATQELYRQLLQMDVPLVPSALSGTSLVPLVGRDPEWAQLQGAWHKAAAGGPGFVLLTGEAGSGATRLAEELRIWATRQGIATASARCYEAEGGLAYAPVTAWLRARPLPPLADVWLTEVARLLPELLAQRPDLSPPAALIDTWQRQRLFEALAKAIVGSGQPLLLIMDDMQWCDRDTLEWLHYLLRFDLEARLLVVATLRAGETPPDHPLVSLLEALRRRDQLTEIELGPLNEAQSFDLAVHLAGRELDPALAAPLYQGSEGNPLFLVEMVRVGLSQERPWSVEHGRRMVQANLPMPPKVRMVIEARLAQLAPEARELVEVAATIGREFSFEVLARASGAEQDSLVPALDELWRRRIVREQGNEAYDFSHDKIREVAYSAVSAARRRLLHRRVAEALESTHVHDPDAVAATVAAHYEQASEFQKAFEWYVRAAEAAQQLYSNQAAAEYIRRALALLESESLVASSEQWRRKESTRLRKRLADLLTLAGQNGEVNTATERALDADRQ